MNGAGIVNQNSLIRKINQYLLRLVSRKFSVAGYLRMQKTIYEAGAGLDKVGSGEISGDHVVGSWKQHDDWVDYEDYLMRYIPESSELVALEYGCGPGRNIRRWSNRFKRIDGVDISKKNLDNAHVFLKNQISLEKKPNLYLTQGANCGAAPLNSYDFAFSTICLQHICVHKIRYSILQSLYDCLKQSGRLSIQMGYGDAIHTNVSYYENNYSAMATNGACDVKIKDPTEVAKDLKDIGFVDLEFWIRPVGPGDKHPNWIFFTAVKPIDIK